jgi:type II secretory ATPase GspE/PulE/Tfp pilus assembly ATPase PilB-like protein
LVGEIRDHETAEMAVQASLTGHLLLSTLHTNSAAGTIPRLANLNVDPFLIAQALAGVISQRLVARVCSHCAGDYLPSAELLRSIGVSPEEAFHMRFRKGRGCRACHHRGYLGRLGVFEVMLIDDELRRMIMARASEQEISQVAIKRGMRPLRDAVLEAARTGVTTPEEVGRVVLAKEVD